MASNAITEPVFLCGERNTKNISNSNSKPSSLISQQQQQQQHDQEQQHVLELQLLPSSSETHHSLQLSEDNYATHLKLSIGSCEGDESNDKVNSSNNNNAGAEQPSFDVSRLKEFANEELKLAMAEKAYAEEARREAKRHIEIAELEFANAKRIRQQAHDELEKAQLLKEQASKRISSTMLQITCQACKQQFQASTVMAVVGVGPSDETSLAMSYMSSATTEGEGEWRSDDSVPATRER